MQHNLHKTVFIDIETASSKATLQELPEDMQLLWQKKSKVLFKEDANYEATYTNGAAIYAEFGKIICVCLGYFTDKELKNFKVKQISGHNEAELLTELWAIFNKFFFDHTWQLCGHNIKEFDVPYLCRRSMINGVELPFFFKDLQNRKPWESPIVDTLHLWRFGDFKHYTSLELLAQVLAIPTPKDDISGAEVGEVYWVQNNLPRIAAYCQKDVLTVAQVALKFNTLPLIASENVTFI
jgi:3'-5' exonuclease